MALSTEDAVRETHRVALEENLRKNLYTQEEFDRYTEIAKEAAQRIDAEKDAFRANYHQRVTEATAVILREHEARTLDYPKPDWAVDVPPSAEKVDLLARNRVQAEHEARIAAIRVDQTHKYQELHQACQVRESARETTRERDPVTDEDPQKGRVLEAFNLTNQVSPHEARTRGRSGPS